MSEATPLRGRIRVRLLSLVAFGLLAPLAAMAALGSWSIRETERRVLSERQVLASSVAERISSLLAAQVDRLQEIAGSSTFDQASEATRAELRYAFVRRHLVIDETFLADAQGRISYMEPKSRPLAAPLAQVVKDGRPLISDLIPDADGGRRLYVLLPAKNWSGEVLGLVGGVIDPLGPHLPALLRRFQLAASESIDLVDGKGTVIASTDEGRLFLESDHAQFLASLIRDHRTTSGACHGCHQQEGASAPRTPEVMAFAPLPAIPWGVVVRQPESEAFAFSTALSHNGSLVALSLLVLGLLLARGAARSVTRPLATLAASAERIAKGELDSPIPPVGNDEIGWLGASFERMRLALKRSLETVEKSNRELEARVLERTAELEKANAELKRREEGRAQLLHKVIGAQEDERKRIARELHDETTQSLAALTMRLESAVSGEPPGKARQSLAEAKELAVHTLDEVHRLIVDLRPSVLDDLGLRSAVRWYAERVLKGQGVVVRFEAEGMDERLPPQLEIAIFRAVQETLTNIAKHARAESVLIQCALSDGLLAIDIEDDGRGFEVSSLAAPGKDGRGWGLLGIRERVELMGGEVRIESAPGQGCLVAIRVPVPKEAPHG